jgi:hypothetical protein
MRSCGCSCALTAGWGALHWQPAAFLQEEQTVGKAVCFLQTKKGSLEKKLSRGLPGGPRGSICVLTTETLGAEGVYKWIAGSRDVDKRFQCSDLQRATEDSYDTIAGFGHQSHQGSLVLDGNCDIHLGLCSFSLIASFFGLVSNWVRNSSQHVWNR